jgi:hypothetical protein
MRRPRAPGAAGRPRMRTRSRSRPRCSTTRWRTPTAEGPSPRLVVIRVTVAAPHGRARYRHRTTRTGDENRAWRSMPDDGAVNRPDLAFARHGTRDGPKRIAAFLEAFRVALPGGRPAPIGGRRSVDRPQPSSATTGGREHRRQQTHAPAGSAGGRERGRYQPIRPAGRSPSCRPACGRRGGSCPAS